MISIDSDVLRGLATAANATVSEISAGVEKLNAVTTHDDWNCAERDQINEQITAAKKEDQHAQYQHANLFRFDPSVGKSV